MTKPSLTFAFADVLDPVRKTVVLTKLQDELTGANQ